MTDKLLDILEFAPAKVNLALHVTARRADGYHLLDSIVVFANVGDMLHAQKAETLAIDVTGPAAEALPKDTDNLVIKAAQTLMNTWPEIYGGCHFRLEKHLPVASGIGGGSADAAAALRAMVRLYGPPPVREPKQSLSRLALDIGADVPVCLIGRACRMRGIGEVVTPIVDFPVMYGILANPRIAVPTGAVFSRLALKPEEVAFSALGTPLPEGNARAWCHWLTQQRNDLESAARTCAPEIARCLSVLKTLPDVRLVRMSGSGATCFALFDNQDVAENAARLLRDYQPHWWIVPVHLGHAKQNVRAERP